MVNPHKTWDREDNLNKLLSFLKQTKEADFGTLRKYLGVSAATLTTYLKQLENEKKIEHFEKPGDRRQTWYRLKLESTNIINAQLGKYEATKFIESLNNPLYIVEPKGDYAISLFAEWDKVRDRAKTEQQLRNAVRLIATFYKPLPIEGRTALVVSYTPKKINGESTKS